MRITGIQIADLSPSETEVNARGNVTFMSHERRIHLRCEVCQGEGLQDKVKRRIALFNDALRQLRRMPEYRGSDQDIQFAPGLLETTLN